MLRGIRNGIRCYARPMPWQNDSFLDIGSRQIFNEEHDMIREQFRYFLVYGIWCSFKIDFYYYWGNIGILLTAKEFLRWVFMRLWTRWSSQSSINMKTIIVGKSRLCWQGILEGSRCSRFDRNSNSRWSWRPWWWFSYAYNHMRGTRLCSCTRKFSYSVRYGFRIENLSCPAVIFHAIWSA